jgi:hypothetical protein
MQFIKLLSLGFLVVAGVSAMPAPGNGNGNGKGPACELSGMVYKYYLHSSHHTLQILTALKRRRQGMQVPSRPVQEAQPWEMWTSPFPVSAVPVWRKGVLC